MYFDALTSAAVADDCRLLIGGRIQQVVQMDEWTIGLEVYYRAGDEAQGQRGYIVASAHPQRSRLHLSSVKPRRGVEAPSPLLLLLRKYVRGAHIVAVHSPQFERIVSLDVEGIEGQATLVIEAMGRHANVMLLNQQGTVLDAIKRVGPQLSRVRPILPGRFYVPPPPQDKLDPPDVTELRLREMLGDSSPETPIWRILVREVRAISPLLAREVVYRALGSDAATVAGVEISHLSPLLDAFEELTLFFWERDWRPSLGLEGGLVIAYAPYELRQYAEREATGSISEAVDRYYREIAQGDAYAPAKARVQRQIDAARKRVLDRRNALRRQLVSGEEIERLRLSGEMILGYAHAVHPGDTQLEAQVDLDGPPLIIELDPQLTPVENAQAYFERYDRAKSAAAEIPDLLARADLELAYLDQLATDLELASNWPDIGEVQSALVEGGYLPRKRGPRVQKGEPLRVMTEEGILILVGRSARQNHDVTFRQAAPDDLWLHVVDAPGAHVVVKSGGQPVPDRVLRQAATLAARHSALRGETSVLVAYTERRYVRPIRGAGPGMVTYRHEKTTRVEHGYESTFEEGVP
jgi:predicted ribosome quality control (RQC) complex YloA/Tae2 family protein